MKEKSSVNKTVKKVSLYHAVFSSPEGQQVLYDLMKTHGVLGVHPADPQEMALKEGERKVVLRIMSFLRLNPKTLLERIANADRYEE